MSSSPSFPRQHARTQRLTLGEPRTVTVLDRAGLALFCRSDAGDDPVNHLWKIDLATGTETRLVDARDLLADDEELPAAERARRERMREGAGGITAYSTGADESVVFALGGRLFRVAAATGDVDEVTVDTVVFDPHLNRRGDRIAFVSGDELRVVDASGAPVWELADAADTVSWGSADFVAAEEMHRFRGFWWAPDGDRIAACRNDVADVPIWHIAQPADPAATPAEHRYPHAGSTNPAVELFICGPDGSKLTVEWDRAALPYLADVNWNDHGLTITVQSRDQRRVEFRRVDPGSGETALVIADSDDRWVELVPGTGALIDPDRVVTAADRDGARRLLVGDEIVSPPDVQIRSVIAASAERIIASGNPLDEPTVLHIYRWTDDGFEPLTTEPGVHAAASGSTTIAVKRASLDAPGARWTVRTANSVHHLRSNAETPLVTPNVTLITAGPDALATAVLLPHDHDGSPLPVLLDPYGGPHAQRVLRSYNAMCTSQWFADQGFAVVITDGRGTPGRGSAFERTVHHNLADAPLDDQVVGLEAAAERFPLDLDRVAIRGWSFGGYLAALAVLRRPDVFHAAIAGAPVTEWRLYDTHYTERYLGDPDELPDVYDHSSLLPIADRLERPLLLIHGLADDNVVAAHTLQLSSELLAAGRPHEVLPLVGVTHMTPQEVVAENLLLHQLQFLRRSLEGTTVAGNG